MENILRNVLFLVNFRATRIYKTPREHGIGQEVTIKCQEGYEFVGRVFFKQSLFTYLAYFVFGLLTEGELIMSK